MSAQTEPSPHRFSLSVRLAAGAFFALMVALSVGAAVKTVDAMIGVRHVKDPRHPEEMQPIVFEWYPYSVGHMAADMVWDKEIRIGQMGYWYPDFDFNHPPPKAPNESRIILIGGSGAQGQGGTWPNEKMLYAQIEKRLNEYLGYTGKRFRVINMAMGGSRTYHNFIDLNLFAHRLDPDMILTYSGFNDWVVPYFFEREPKLLRKNGDRTTGEAAPPSRARGVRRAGLLPSSDRFLSGAILRDWYPHLFFPAEAGGTVIRRTYPPQPTFAGAAPQDAMTFQSRREFFDKFAVPLYTGALKSIRRDFPGVPILVAWQSIETDPDEFKSYGDPMKELGPDFYNRMFETAKTATEDYGTGDWLYINTHRMYQDDPRLFGFHMLPEAQATNGDAIAQRIALYFDPNYANAHPDVAAAIYGENYKLYNDDRPPGSPRDWTDSAYLYANPDVAKMVKSGKYTSGWDYFNKRGRAEGRLEGSPQRWNEFDYLRKNPDVTNAVQDGRYSSGLQHWLLAGQREGRKGGIVPGAPLPSREKPTPVPEPEMKVPGAPAWWDERRYLTVNPDVRNAVRDGHFASGYDHWIKAGKTEGRPGVPPH